MVLAAAWANNGMQPMRNKLDLLREARNQKLGATLTVGVISLNGSHHYKMRGEFRHNA